MSDDSADDLYAESPDTKPSDEITMKRSSYRSLVIIAMTGIVIGAFFAGYFVAFMTNSDDYVTQAQLQNMLSDQPTKTAAKLVISLDDDPMIGNPDAPVTIVEFSDFQCPFCSRFHQQTLPLIAQNYINTGIVNLVYRDFPIDSIHPNARITHIAAECADEQDRFWQYHDILFSRQSEWNNLDSESILQRVIQYANTLSLDIDAFTQCLDSPQINDEINADRSDASKYGVTGTPAFFIGNEKSGYTLLSGAKPFDAFEQTIQQKLN